jgi:hypothetical protein
VFGKRSQGDNSPNGAVTQPVTTRQRRAPDILRRIPPAGTAHSYPQRSSTTEPLRNTAGTLRRRPPRIRMDTFHRDLLTYMLLWGPHGKLYDEDLYPRFGMNVSQFRRRFSMLATRLDQSELDPADLALLAKARLYLANRSDVNVPQV